jgi:hypothetical protein
MGIEASRSSDEESAKSSIACVAVDAVAIMSVFSKHQQ